MEQLKTDVSPKTNTQSSTIKWPVVCLGVVIVTFVAITIFKVSLSNLFIVGTLLLCPLIHLWIMKDGSHKH